MKKNVLERIERIDELIRIKGTGGPSDLAGRLNMSERTIYQYLNMMRDMGAPIKFCPIQETYFYIEEGGFMIRFLPGMRHLLEQEEDIENNA